MEELVKEADAIVATEIEERKKQREEAMTILEEDESADATNEEEGEIVEEAK
jgi:hypothetical protein